MLRAKIFPNRRLDNRWALLLLGHFVRQRFLLLFLKQFRSYFFVLL
jgi:hypothetical protein